MHAAVRPYATAGVALVGASVIAVSPIHPPLPDIQVHNPVAQLAALADPFQAYTQVFQEAVANVEPILAAAAANPTPILTKIVQNQIASLEALLALIPTTTAGALTAPTTTASANSTPNPPATSQSLPPAIQSLPAAIQMALGQVSTALMTTVPQLLQGASADLMSANVEGAINGVLLAGLTALSPLLGLVTPVTAAITQPLQDVVNAINTLGPVGVILANPLQNVVNALDALTADPTAFQTFVIGLTGPLISGIGATGAAIQGVVDAIGGGDSQTIASAVIDAPAVVLGAVLNGQFGGQGFGPDLASLALPGFPPNPVCTTLCAGGILNPLELAGTAILTPGVIPTLQSLQNLIAGALKPPPIATAEAAPLQLTNAGATNAPSALPNLTATTMTLPTTQTSETSATDPTGGTSTNGSTAEKVTGTTTTTPAADPTDGTGTNGSTAEKVTGTTTTTPAADPTDGTGANGSAAAKVTKTTTTRPAGDPTGGTAANGSAAAKVTKTTTTTPAGDPTSGRGANGLTGGNTAGGNDTKETDRKPSSTAAKTAAGHTGASGDEAKHASHE